jgi:protein SCO1
MITKFHSFTKLFLLSFSLIVLVSFTACRSNGRTASPNAKRYEVKGKVVSANKASSRVTIDHEEIPGYMAKMTMDFTLNDEWVYSELTPGALIQATLVVDGNKSWLENPVVTKIADPNLARSEETGVEPGVGTETPDFTLINQDGRKISFKQYRGRALLLTFIYTRCPLPDYCPLMSRNFSQIDQELQKNPVLKARTHLLSISVDPAYDKPRVLREYGSRYVDKADAFRHWDFASGSTEEVKKVAHFFGLNYWEENDQIIHGLRTAIIAPDGKVFKVYRENDWTPEQIIKDLEMLKLS